MYPRYQRNNKTGGQKHLRCFPQCSGGMHNQTGFCGDSVKIKVENCIPGVDYIAVGVFALYHDVNRLDANDSSDGAGLPHTLTDVTLEAQLNSVDQPLKPWFCAIEVKRERGGSTILYDFNNARRGWHYGWFSTKTTKDYNHVFNIAVGYRITFV